ncbi:MAG TPA: glutamyl-tRNA reductase [Candidatus Bathyarchaeia archaeon]|nr:glutamyl-tRNA reductase [Candidatus Bathyarchaeia archaeon]
MIERLFVAGLSHRTAPLEVREQLALDEDKLREVLGDLAGRGTCAEVLIVSTCNRVEVYGVADVPGEARSAAFRRMGSQRGMAFPALEPLLYTMYGPEAVQHAFRVASSLDSMVLGEPQILGQVKDAFALAQACRTVGPVLHSLMSQAFTVAKRVRSDTEVGRHAVSVAFAAVELARRIFDGLAGRSVLLVGAGEMGELAARHLQDQGTLPVYVANRTASRAQELARELSGTAVPFEELFAVMAQVDIVITSTGATEPIVTAPDVARAVHGRRGRPLFFIDIAVPRNVAPDVNDLDDVFVYDVDDLRSVVEANLRERMREAQRAEALVAREVVKFSDRLRSLEVVPTIVSLREKLEEIRQAELARALGRLPGADPATRQALEALSQGIVNKVLHAPTVKLRDSSKAGHGRRWIEVISELFGLGGKGRGEPEA